MPKKEKKITNSKSLNDYWMNLHKKISPNK